MENTGALEQVQDWSLTLCGILML